MPKVTVRTVRDLPEFMTCGHTFTQEPAEVEVSEKQLAYLRYCEVQGVLVVKGGKADPPKDTKK